MSLAHAAAQRRWFLALAAAVLLALLLIGIGLIQGRYWQAAASEVLRDYDSVSRPVENERAISPRPVILAHTSRETYRTFLADSVFSQQIWIRSEPVKLVRPSLKLPTFWQFTNRTRVAGVNTYVDLNLFNGVRVGVEMP